MIGEIKSIGRFQIESVLGEGGQGIVYLARDPHLGRRVAIKVIATDAEFGDLLDEARIVSRLQHPNIVTLFDAEEYEGKPYLVFEFVEGKTLQQLIKEKGAIPKIRAAGYMVQILEGVSAAHRQKILHRDLKPANVMIDANDVPRIMDFGIAQSFVDQPLDSSLQGSPLYVAPEYVKNEPSGLYSDVFSLGMMFYVMLTGKHPVSGDSVQQILDGVSRRPVPPPSKQNSDIDERLDSIVLKALEIDPAKRYQDADSFMEALTKYLEPESEEIVADANQSTLDFLLRRMRHKSDFPAISQAISEINKISASDKESVSALSNVVLRDFSLTNKLLKIVNAACYGHFGGTISTVSRAVVILGFDAIRNIALNLILFEHLQNKGQAAKLKDKVIGAFFSGIVAKELAHKVGVKDSEEAFICSMFHNLGRLLSTFYFPEETQEIERLMEQKSLGEAEASMSVLGISYEELGVGVARKWNLPEKIVSSMREVTDEKVKKPDSEMGRLRVLASLSNELCSLAGEADEAEAGAVIKQLSIRFNEAIGMSDKVMLKALGDSMKTFQQDAKVLEVNTQQSVFLKKVRHVSGVVEKEPEIAKEKQAAVEQKLEDEFERTIKIDSSLETEQKAQREKPDSQTVLAAGIQDIMNSIVDTYELNDILRMVLETLYRGMDFSRVLLCIKDAKLNAMIGRFGLGEDVDSVVKRFRFPLSGAKDVFLVALAQGIDIFIEDVDAENIRSRIPTWYRTNVKAKSFILFPILVDKKPVGLLYADQIEPGKLKIESKDLSLLKTLRNQAVLAIKQKL